MSGAKAAKNDIPMGDADKRAEGRDLEADIERLREDIARLTEHLMQAGNRGMRRARRAAMDSADQLRGSAEDLQNDMAETVRERPFAALALAAAAGFLVAVMMRR